MFNSKRYLTRGVDLTIPLELQIFMWSCIDNIKVEKDYLQVFNLSVVNGIQRVEHKQRSSQISKYLLCFSIQSSWC